MKYAFLSAMCTMLVAAATHGRTWTDTDGQKLEAEWLGVEKDSVVLKRESDGREFTVPITRFSLKDRVFIKEVMDGPEWTEKMERMKVPALSTAQGKLNGVEVSIEGAKLRGNKLWLHGEDGVTFSVQLFVKPDTDLAGTSHEVDGHAAGTGPIVEVEHSKFGRVLYEESLLSRYLMVLRFGKRQFGVLSGTIYVCLPDENKSFIAGSFQADIVTP